MNEASSRELHVGLAAVRQAAVLCRTVQAGIRPETLAKKDRSPVTIADFGSQALICRSLHQAFPADPVMAEEDSSELSREENLGILERVVAHVGALEPSATARAVCEWIDRGRTRQFCDRFWTLDPIDGTKGFLRREQYAISLALIVGGRIELGIVGCPNLPLQSTESGVPGSVFYAARGQGAWMEALELGDAAQPIRVSAGAEAAACRFCESVESGHSAHDHAAEIARRLGITREPLRMDSQAKYAVVARGEADIYMRLPTRADYREKIWDHAGGALVVSEAGGTVSDVAGKPLEFTHGPELSANRGVIVANPSLHSRVLEAIAAVGVVR